MRIYLSPKKEHRWLFQPFRESFSGAGRESKIRNSAKKNDFRYLNIFPSGDTLHAAFTSENNAFDFAARFLTYCESSSLENVIYTERSTDEACALVVIKNGKIYQDKVGDITQVEKWLTNLLVILDVSEFKLINFQFINGEVLLNLKNKLDVKLIDNLSGALTDSLEPNDDVFFLSERDAMNKINTRKPWLLYFVLAAVLVLLFNSFLGESEPSDTVDLSLDPNEVFYESMSTDVIQVLNRMGQDYNIHIGLMSLTGWTADKVIHTKGQVSYRMRATENGDISTLKAFGKQNNLHLMVSSNETVLLGVGANKSVYQLGEAPIYDVEDVHHFISDAVNSYIPNAEITFIRDIPQGKKNSRKWVVRELMFQFRGLYKEDLMTLGAITSNLPISLGGDSKDPKAGQYIVDSERFTGGLVISIFGDKK
ncbi:hypothetical protein FQP81_18265 [Pseudoalteromonas distincta]|uniref:hypothetical protein n=1 Tax=Pseudoalteromonas distincta TaxID=77608 RepID=UPI00118FB69B|nr:hypothetical protein [Pseudoalteromonas elyakovii]TVU70401.1 hypothetical protein FQP81_18265 [Pseudoalteromonas elyakovii]